MTALGEAIKPFADKGEEAVAAGRRRARGLVIVASNHRVDTVP